MASYVCPGSSSGPTMCFLGWSSKQLPKRAIQPVTTHFLLFSAKLQICQVRQNNDDSKPHSKEADVNGEALRAGGWRPARLATLQPGHPRPEEQHASAGQGDAYLAGEEDGGIVVLVVVVVEAVVLVLPLAEVLESGGGVPVDLQPLLLLAQGHHLHHGQPDVVLQAGVGVEPGGDGGQAGKSREHMEGEREAKNPKSLLLPGRQSGERGKGGEEARNRQVEKFEHFPLLFHFSAVVTGSSPAAAGAGARSAATRHFLGLRWGPFPSFAPFCFEEEKGRQEIQAPKTASIVSGEMVKKKKKKAPKKRKTSWISVKAPSLVSGDWQTAHSLPRPWLEGSMGSGKAGGRGPLRIPTLLISPAEVRTLRSQGLALHQVKHGCMGNSSAYYLMFPLDVPKRVPGTGALWLQDSRGMQVSNSILTCKQHLNPAALTARE
ncbi:uncharacterized protein LOC135407230 [Pseudopipra pipra]|uniref:uncharacterized protein LOC135407230 n=1 Tax=Pseudopipra pipra TaxID=415032 RepID=UPI00313A3773